jgi:hypothetical protein
LFDAVFSRRAALINQDGIAAMAHYDDEFRPPRRT